MSVMRLYKPRDPGSPKEAVARLYDQVGGVPEVMVRLGVSRTQAYAYIDPEGGQEIGFSRVAALTGPAARAAAEYLCFRAGALMLPLPEGGDAAGIGAMTAESAARFGSLMRQMVTSLEDGVVTRAEARAGLEEIRRFLEPLSPLVQALRDLAEEGGAL